MAVDIPAIREIAERVFARQDVLDACRRRDLSWPITVLGANGVTQAQIATLTGIPQGRLSEYKTRKRVPAATSTFEAFADGLWLPPAARLAFGLAPAAAGSVPLDPAGGQSAGGRVPAWEMFSPCSATCRGAALSRCCRRFAASIAATSKRTG